MSQTKVKKQTPEQAALIPVYRSQAEETVKSADSAIGFKAPEIIFVDRICQ
ncbi:hypothetical protein QUA82_21500 [Microcoleus sp. F8-D3]